MKNKSDEEQLIDVTLILFLDWANNVENQRARGIDIEEKITEFSYLASKLIKECKKRIENEDI